MNVRMTVPVFASLAALALGAGSGPAFAAASYYRAQPVSPPAETRIVLRDVIWACGETGCSGSKSNSRPAIVCAVLAREVGALESFSIEGRRLDRQELEKCNSRAK